MSAKERLENIIQNSNLEKLQYILLRAIDDDPTLITKLEQYSKLKQDMSPKLPTQTSPKHYKTRSPLPIEQEMKIITERNEHRKSKLIVSWFIKSSQILFDNSASSFYKHIPAEIADICLLFYRYKINYKSNLSERDFYKRYWIEAGKIGPGAFARIRKITRKTDKKIFALSMIKKKGKCKEDIAALRRKILVLMQCNHNNIVQLIDWCDTRKRIYLVQEYCDGGDVLQRILQQKTFDEHQASKIVSQIASALYHLHCLGYVHRDLTLGNLMYTAKDGLLKEQIKIIGFELVGDCNNKDGVCTTPVETLHYTAPEVIQNKTYNQSVDMWSLGVIIYMLLCGTPPFYDAANNMKNLYDLIKKGQYEFFSPLWDNISEHAKDLIQKLIVIHAEKRLCAGRVLKHAWIVDNDNNNSNKSEMFTGKYYQQFVTWQSK